MTPTPRLTNRPFFWWLIPVILAGIFHSIILPFESELALQNDANFYLGGAASLAAGSGYHVEPYLDLPSVSQYPPLQSAWLAVFWKLGGGFPGNIPWLIGAMEVVSLAMLTLLALCLKREGIPFGIGAAFILVVGTSFVLLNMTFLLFSDLTFALLGIALIAWIGPDPEPRLRNSRWWCGIGILVALLMLCRSAGLAPLVGIGIVWIYRRFRFRDLPWRTGIAFLAPVAAALLIKRWATGASGSYGDYFSARIIELGGWPDYLRFVIGNIADQLGGRFWVDDWFNVPSRLPLAKRVVESPLAPFVNLAVQLLGCSITFLIFYAAWVQRKSGVLRATVLVAAIYFALICIWPFRLGTRAILPWTPIAMILVWRGIQSLPAPSAARWLLTPSLLVFLSLNVAGNVVMSLGEAKFIRTIYRGQAAEIREIARWLGATLRPGELVCAGRDVPVNHLRHHLGQRLLACPTPYMKVGAFYDIPPALQGNRTATYWVTVAGSDPSYGNAELRIEKEFGHFVVVRVVPH